MAERKKTIKPLSTSDQAYAKELILRFDGTIRRIIRVYLDKNMYSEFEDIVQGIYEMICKQLDDFRMYDSQEALIVTIATRYVWRVQRQRKELIEIHEEYMSPEKDRGLTDILPFSTSEEDIAVLRAAYEYRDTAKDIAKDTGRTPAAVRQQLKRARDRLREKLKNI